MLEIIGAADFEDIDTGALFGYIEGRHPLKVLIYSHNIRLVAI
jgi:hypothetical protein